MRPDNQHEMVAINQEFGADGIDPKTGQKGKRNNLALGQYSVRVTAGQNFQTRQEQALQQLLQAIKMNPAMLQNPAFAAKLVRMIGQGNPEMEGIADLIAPSPTEGATPAQIAQQNQNLQLQVKQLTQLISKMHMDAESKLPRLQLDKYKADLDAIVRLAVAEIDTKAQDQARAAADDLASRQMAHEAAMQAVDNDQATQMAQVQQPAAPAEAAQ